MRPVLAIALALFPAAALAEGDPAAGEKAFRKCMACHSVEEGAPAKAGPNLHGVVGRTTGTLEGFGFSDAMKEVGAGGHTWTPEELDAFIANPKGLVPGTKMTFPGVKNETERANIVAYLQSQS